MLHVRRPSGQHEFQTAVLEDFLFHGSASPAANVVTARINPLANSEGIFDMVFSFG
ncbi:MAG: hypothetical protein M3Y27_20920 [Acidobacteriota bacterium]|nr:hypothetical protein [Acidobacteriota bacterium]MDQ2972435.1 hypothetical protein [Pseudomonadota bacterium]